MTTCEICGKSGKDANLRDARAIACLPDLIEAARALLVAECDSIPEAEAAENLRRVLARIDGEEA